MDEAKKLAQVLSNRKKELMAAMFNENLASFVAFSSMGDASLGELDIANTELKPVDIWIAFEFVLPLEHDQRIVAFTFEHSTKMNCFDLLGRLLGVENIQVEREKVVGCGPDKFVVCHNGFDTQVERLTRLVTRR